MDSQKRRSLLATLGSGLGASLAGCLGDGSPGTDDDRSTPTGTATPTATTATDGGLSREVVQLGGATVRPAWRADEDATGQVRLFASAAAARGVLDLAALPDDRRDAAESLLAATDFSTERLLYVASVGPDTCHDRVAVAGLSLEEGVLVGRGRAEDGSDGDQACGEAVTYPAALVRVGFGGEPADTARVAVTDGWGTTAEVVATAVARDPGALAGHVAPEGEPGTVPEALTCEESGFQRHPAGYEAPPPYGLTTDGWGAFALRVDGREFDRGDAVTVTMTNVGAGEGTTGNRWKFNLEVLTEAGWQDVRGTTDGDFVGYTDEAVLHAPGEGFEWTFAMTEAGVLADHPQADRLTVCPGLPAGRYRFVRWEPAVAVAFDLR